MNLSPAAKRDARIDARIDAVVREVLARLHRAGGAAAAGKASPLNAVADAAPRPAAAAASQRVHLDGPVISLATIQALPPHVSQASITTTAVVTPAARDAVRQRGLSLEITSPPNHSPESMVRLLLADAECPRRQAAAANHLQRRGVAVAPVAASDIVPQVLEGRSTGILLADLPALHVCSACRHGGVRAAAVGSPDEARAIAAVMDVNLWVVDMKRLPLARTLMLMQQIAEMPSVSPRPPAERDAR